MKVIYIAGPYRASTEYGVKCNIDRAENVALFVWLWGGAAICPHKNTAFFGGAMKIQDETWLQGDLAILKRCDAVLAMFGYEKSIGAYAEVEFARRLGIPVFMETTDDELLREFLRSELP